MQYARKLRRGDKVAIVSLSSGMLGEEFCSHNRSGQLNCPLCQGHFELV